MKFRDVLILAGLIFLILFLTVAEKYAGRQRDARQSREAAVSQQRWADSVQAAFDNRWNGLSLGLRRSLDSIARAVIASGVPPESLVAIVAAPLSPPPSGSDTPARTSEPRASPVTADSLSRLVAQDYEAALASLPADLNVYERRIATNEAASLVRARHRLTADSFDSLLKRASTPP